MAPMTADVHACPICGDPMRPAFTATVLGRHEVAYAMCPGCGLLQTETPTWLEEAYATAIRTLESILDELDAAGEIRPIDFFSLDVEGYESQVLRGLNLDRYRPRMILVEARFFDDVDTLLRPHYELVDRLTEHDVLYRLR